MDILQINKPRASLQKRLGLDYWSNVILALYILTMPFVSAFAFTGTISLPLIFAVFLLMLMVVKIIQTGKLPEGFLGFDLVIIFLFLFFVLFSYIINGLGNSKSLNHTVAYLSTFLLFYVAIKFTLFNLVDKNRVLERVLQLITYATLVSAVYASVEFILSNIYGININDYIPRPSEAEAYYDATVLALFYRARGFAPESGHFAFMMELFSPLVIYYLYFSGFCNWSKVTKAAIIIFIILSFLFAVSSASFVIIPIAIFLTSLVYIKRIFLYIKRHFIKFILITGISTVVVLLLNYFFSFYALIFLSVSEKMDSNSFDDRREGINLFYQNFSHLNFIKKIIGAGPAGFNILGFDESKSIISLYYLVAFELGLFGLMLIFLFLIYIIINAVRITDKIGFFLVLSICSGAIHFYFIGNFWYPWFWFVAVFVMFCNRQNNLLPANDYKKTRY